MVAALNTIQSYLTESVKAVDRHVQGVPVGPTPAGGLVELQPPPSAQLPSRPKSDSGC